MDFIVKLLKSESINIDIKYNNILTIINKFIKYTYLVLYIKVFKVKQTI